VSDLLLDTNVISALRLVQQQPPSFGAWLAATALTDCYVSCLTWMELRSGILKKQRTDPAQAEALARWYDNVHQDFRRRTLPFDDLAAIAAAPWWSQRPRGTVDTLVAGSALAGQLDLVTRNVSDFADIPGLRLVNPWWS